MSQSVRPSSFVGTTWRRNMHAMSLQDPICSAVNNFVYTFIYFFDRTVVCLELFSCGSGTRRMNT